MKIFQEILRQGDKFLASFVGETVSINGKDVIASVWGQQDADVDLGTGKVVSRLMCRVPKHVVQNIKEGQNIKYNSLTYRIADLIDDPVDTSWQFRMADPKKIKPLR